MIQPSPIKFKYQSVLQVEYITIAASTNESTILDCAGMQPRSLWMPPTWTFSQIRCYKSYDGINFYVINGIDGTTFNLTLGGLVNQPLYPILFDDARFLRIYSVTDQESDVTLAVSLMPQYQGVHN